MLIKNIEELKVFFRERDISLTKPRLEIGYLLLKTPQHLSSAEVVEQVQKHYPQASRATIFNTLNLFVEHNLIQKLDVPANKTIYDSNTYKHHHIYKTQSMEVVDISLSSDMENQVFAELLKSVPSDMRKHAEKGKMQITLHIDA